MGSKLKSVFSTQNILLFLVIFALLGCASIQKPLGGPRDHTPPKLLLSTPVNETRNFKAPSIKLDFDEYFKLSNQYSEITISPAMEKIPDYKIKQKSLVIQFNDTLQKNTTYVINFGKAIMDVNEGNILKNFTYVFSTGSHIDSLNLTGNVINTLTQEKEKEVTVMLLPIKQDSLIFGKKKPAIYTTTDTSGNFSLANLHDGVYRIYALKETAPNKIYDNEAELIAFKKDPIRLYKDTSDIQLALFKQSPDKFRAIEHRFDPDGKMFFTFNQQLADPSIRINYPPALDNQKLLDINKTHDTAMVYLKNMDFDSISVSVMDKGKALDTISLRKGRKEAFQRNIGLSYNLDNSLKLKPNTDLTITSNSPIEGIDPSLIFLAEDSVNVTAFTIQRDPTSLKKFALKYRWKQDRKYQLTFNEGSFVNIYGDKNKRTNRSFMVDKPENYGTLTSHITVPDTSKSYIVELLNDQKNIVQRDVIKKKGDIIYKQILAGKYRVRVIYDDNNNGKWDSGNVRRKLYPENIWLFPDLIPVKANWEPEETISIPKEIIIP